MIRTRGPWKVTYDGDSLPIIDSPLAIIALVRTNEDDANLLAAAPELLALLIESQDSIGGDWRNRRDAAIAKATGET